jgi:hypothetical protein
MQVVRSFSEKEAAQVGWSVRAMLVSTAPEAESARRLAGLGLHVECVGDIYTALSLVTEDPNHTDMLVVDCDGTGGLAEARRIVKLMGEVMLRVPVILISAECSVQSFALERHEPTVLRAPLSAVSLRVAFEHVLRGKLVPRFA